MIKAIITGHSRGLGAAIAARLLEQGVQVLGIARSENAALAARFPQTFTQQSLDLADSGQLVCWLESNVLDAFVADAEQVLLVNNAGLLAPVGPLTTQAPATIAQAINCNVAAALMLSAAVAKAVGGEAGNKAELRILHISSGAGRNAIPGWSIYGAGKAALDHHARVVAAEAPVGLRICSLAPGVIDTDMQAEIRGTPVANFPLRQKFEALKANGGLSTPEDCAAGVAAHLLDARFGDTPVADLRELG